MTIEVKELHTDNKTAPAKVEVTHKNTTTFHECNCCKLHKETKLSMIAGSRWELRNILPKWFQGLGAKEIISHEQSESEGNVTLTVFYR